MGREPSVDPTSDVGTVSKEDAPRCTVCETPIVNDLDHYVVTWIEDGAVQRRDFCSAACRAEWSG